MRQRLAGPRPPPDSAGIMNIMRDLRYLQLDPMRVVAPSHTLVLWSRLGPYTLSDLETLMWKERRLFDDWAQATSIVLTEDYSIFGVMKRSYVTGDSAWAKKIRDWMEKNKQFAGYILDQLSLNGPMLSSQFEDKAVEDWSSTGWTKGRNVDMMLTILKAQGRIMIAGRKGNQRLWALTERFLPEWGSKEQLSDSEMVRRAAQRSLRALGVARVKHIQQHYIRGCYRDLDKTLTELEAEQRIIRVKIQDRKRSWPDPWYVHADDIPMLDSLEADKWEPRTTLLSPFDNLISDRQRTEQLFNFHYRFEVYVPKPQRKYGCYVMPILQGDSFIGRIDPVMDRKQERLVINAVYAEPNAPNSSESIQAVANTIEELGKFLGAKEIIYNRVPENWKGALH